MGRYEGNLIVEWLPDGRLMQLYEPYAFIDSGEQRWDVPSMARIDGASIPRALWTITGSPYTGKYRNASVVHDYYCSVRKRTPHATHRMFHEAMIVSGVSPSSAKIMYLAVRQFGPKWSDMDSYNSALITSGWPSGMSGGGSFAGRTSSSGGGGFASGYGGGAYGGRGYGGGLGGGFGGIAGINQVGSGPGPRMGYSQDAPTAQAPANVSVQQFAVLAQQISDQAMDLDAIDATVEASNQRELVDLPSGLFRFHEDPTIDCDNREEMPLDHAPEEAIDELIVPGAESD